MGREVRFEWREAWSGDASVEDFRIAVHGVLHVGMGLETVSLQIKEAFVDFISVGLPLCTFFRDLLSSKVT